MSETFTTETFEASGAWQITLDARCYDGVGQVTVVAYDQGGEEVGRVTVVGEGTLSEVVNTEPGEYFLEISGVAFHVYHWLVDVTPLEAEASSAEADASSAETKVGDTDAELGTVSILDGVFTAAQAERGAEPYRTSCAECHGSDLYSTDEYAPDLRGPTFLFRWRDSTLAERFESIRTRMPLGNPGSLDDQTYLDIIAFILDVNGYPAGENELVVDVDALERIVIDAQP